ncbi:LysR family transcriptional regulator [Sinomonas albida]|uniref:LysR family transcriptional regulator n=1 Tax=Sinomonas albida TaxID=369942 RepID=UPI00301A0BCD
MAELTLRQLELFSALPDFPTLSAASERLHISESALSQAITGLEKAVGVQLCVRRKARGLQLTPAGQHFAARARGILKDSHELALELRGGGLRGPVKVGCFASFATSVIPEILDGFPRRYPDVSVDVTVGTHDDLLPALQSGRLDVAIVYDMLLPMGYAQREIYATELEAVLHPEHPLAARSAVDLADLAMEPLIMYESSPSATNTHQAFAARGLRPTVLTSVPQVILVQALVGRGVGYGLLMSRPNSAPMSVEGRPLAVRPLRPRASRTHVVAIWPEDMSLSPRAAALVDYAIEALSGFDEALVEADDGGAAAGGTDGDHAHTASGMARE